MAKLVETNDIPVREMKDGQVGVITEHRKEEYIGRVVQNLDGRLISIGMLIGNSFGSVKNMDDAFRVRILKGKHLVDFGEEA